MIEYAKKVIEDYFKTNEVETNIKSLFNHIYELQDDINKFELINTVMWLIIKDTDGMIMNRIDDDVTNLDLINEYSNYLYNLFTSDYYFTPNEVTRIIHLIRTLEKTQEIVGISYTIPSLEYTISHTPIDMIIETVSNRLAKY